MEKRKRAPASGKSKKPLGQGEKFFAFLKVKTFFLVLAGAVCLAAGGWLIFNWQARAAADAIGLRVMKNDEHLSVVEWYRQNIKVQGSPETIRVDGYPALREGRSVYVNAANIANSRFYTNIYIISYDQQAGSSTQSIFNRLLENWKFSDDIVKKRCSEDGTIECDDDSDCPAGAGSCVATGKCSGNANKTCLYDNDCAGAGYCASGKAEVIRDTVRLGDLAKIKSLLESYAERYGHYPKLESGTYIKGNTLSVWPSWRENLQAELGQALPVDPINKLGACAGFDATTCWNKNTQKFAWGGTTVNLDSVGTAGGKIYAYQYLADNRYKLCSFLENNYSGLDSDRCTENTFDPTQYCQGKCGNVNGVNCGNCSDSTRECINNKCVCRAYFSDCGSGESCSCDLHSGGTCSGGSCCTGSCGNQCGITVCGVSCSCTGGGFCCNGSCCASGTKCVSGSCCVPKTTCNSGGSCGSGSDGCGGQCACPSGQICNSSGNCAAVSSSLPSLTELKINGQGKGALIELLSSGNITVSWQASAANGNSNLQIEIWRAYSPIIGGSGVSWNEIKTFRSGSVTGLTGALENGSWTDNSANQAGFYYYGIHVKDLVNSKWINEPAALGPIEVKVIECFVNNDCGANKLCVQNKCAPIPNAAGCASKSAYFFIKKDGDLGSGCPIENESTIKNLGGAGFNEIKLQCNNSDTINSTIGDKLEIPDSLKTGQHTFIAGCAHSWDVFKTCAYSCSYQSNPSWECEESSGCAGVWCRQCPSGKSCNVSTHKCN